MAFSVVQHGLRLLMMDGTGVRRVLTLPAGITLKDTVPPRFAVFDRYVVLVNTPSQPLIIDSDGVVRVLSPKAPRVAAVVSGAAGGTLSGTYSGIRYTFITSDAQGNLISESDYSPGSNSATISVQDLKAIYLDRSPDTITARRLYRPVTNGAVLFQWVDLGGNILTEIQNDLPDAALSIVEAPILGTPPHLINIASFRGRLFGIGDDDADQLRYTEAGVRWAWPADNVIGIPVIGSDSIGGTALIGRRDALGVGRVNQLAQLTGTGEENSAGEIDFTIGVLAKEIGVLSQESVAVYRDKAYFLWYDGVYCWSADGVQCISDGTVDGLGNVRSWFATDNYFNRSRFPFAFGHVDPIRNKYRLFLASPGSVVEDRWVEFDIRDRTWWGPHKSDYVQPTSVFSVSDEHELIVPVIGARTGDLFEEQVLRTDGPNTPIAFDVVCKKHDMLEPDAEKYYGMITLFGRPQTTGLLTIETTVGELTATTRIKTQYYNMKKARESLGRLGVGKHMRIRMTHQVAGEPVEIFGYEVTDVHGVGRR